MSLLEIENVSAGYGPIEVLKGISIEVREGEIVTMIGANGAGKTTTLMSISGVNRIRAGSIRFQGRTFIVCRLTRLSISGCAILRKGARSSRG